MAGDGLIEEEDVRLHALGIEDPSREPEKGVDLALLLLEWVALT
jgi:hypothetical protein